MVDSVGRVVKARRGALNFTQDEVARNADVTRSWLNALEQGKVNRPGFDKLQRLERTLELPSGRLLSVAGYRVSQSVPTPPEDSIETKLRIIQRMATDLLSVIHAQDGHADGRGDGMEPGVRARVATRERELDLVAS